MKKYSCIVCFALMLFLGQARVNPAHAAVVSTFDLGLEGWTDYEDTCAVAWQPAGTMWSGDINSSWAWVTAPAKFHGKWSSNGTVAVDLNFIGSGTPLLYGTAFQVASGGSSFQYTFAGLPPVNSWQRFSISTAATGWTRVSGNQSLATVLDNVDNFYIRVDFNSYITTTTDAVLLDNVSAPLVPIPAGIWLLGSGLAGLLAVRRKA